MQWVSEVKKLGSLSFPPPAGIRVLLMPIDLGDVAGTLPPFLSGWRRAIERLRGVAPCRSGIGYLTIDERWTPAGARHRRPGLHVDGWADDADGGPWGGGGGWGGREAGMVVAASHVGSVAYAQSFAGAPRRYGDCEHVREQCDPARRVVLAAGTAYQLGGLAVHETLPAEHDQVRQFVRLSMPSGAAWPVSCTPNPLGIPPGGPMALPRPPSFTRWVPTTARR